MCTTCYNIKTPAVHPHSLFTCSECFSQHTVTIYSHSYHRLVFILHTDRVLCEAATQFHTLFTDTCRPGIRPGPVRAVIRWGTGFPVSTAVPHYQCSILIFTSTLMQSEGQAYRLGHKAMLCRMSGAVLSYGCMQHRFGHVSRNGELLTAFLLIVYSPTYRMTDGWLVDCKGLGRKRTWPNLRHSLEMPVTTLHCHNPHSGRAVKHSGFESETCKIRGRRWHHSMSMLHDMTKLSHFSGVLYEVRQQHSAQYKRLNRLTGFH
jgi:hypothetical protein